MKTSCLLISVVALGAAACKGETKEVDKPETINALNECRDKLGDKDEYIAQLESRLGEAERTNGEEIVVRFDDKVVEVTGKGPNQRSGGGARAKVDDEKLYNAFLKAVRGSKGAMQRCYQSALKKDPALQAGATTVTIRVKFDTGGKATNARVNPKVSDNFAGCMQGVARTLTIPEAPIEVAFRAPVELTPE